jgi:hypothetical protein
MVAKVKDLNPDVQDALQLMTQLSDTELRRRSGAQINAQEMQRMLRFTTDPNKPMGHNTRAVNNMIASSSRDHKALSGVALEEDASKTPERPKNVPPGYRWDESLQAWVP